MNGIAKDHGAARWRRRLALAALVLVHLSYYVSAMFTNHMQVFYPWGVIHQGQFRYLDYYQIPNGATALLQGRGSPGAPAPLKGMVVNSNVYHPVTTILLGAPLRLFLPEDGYRLLAVTKLLLSLLVLWTLWRRFGDSPYILAASAVYLVFMPVAIDICIGQYQFFLTQSLLLMLLAMSAPAGRVHRAARAGFWLFCSLMVKPVALLMFPAFWPKGRRQTWLVGSGLFVGVSLAAYWGGWFQDYIQNLTARLVNPAWLFPLYSLEGLSHHFRLSPNLWLSVKGALGGALVTYLFLARPRLEAAAVHALTYFVLCYSLVFEYHFGAIMPCIVVGMLNSPQFRGRSALICTALLTLPSPYFLFRLTGLCLSKSGGGELIASPAGDLVLGLWKVVPLLGLNAALIVAWRREGAASMPASPADADGAAPSPPARDGGVLAS